MHKTRRIDLRVTEKEYDLILQKMAQCKIGNLSAYMIKMAIDGMVINLNMPELKEISSLLRYTTLFAVIYSFVSYPQSSHLSET